MTKEEKEFHSLTTMIGELADGVAKTLKRNLTAQELEVVTSAFTLTVEVLSIDDTMLSFVNRLITATRDGVKSGRLDHLDPRWRN